MIVPTPLQLSLDRTHLDASICGRLDGIAVETLIAELAEMRAEMVPPVSPAPPRLDDESDKTPSVTTEDGPAVRLVPLEGDRIGLWLRNEGLGWLNFRIPIDTACAMRDWLIANTPSRNEESRSDLLSNQVGQQCATH